MEIIEVQIERLREYNTSVRIDLILKDKEFKNLVNSIAYFGLQFPLLINKDFIVISGNQILKVLKSLNYKKVPCIVTDVTENKEWRLSLTLNRIHGSWQIFKLRKLFKDKDLSDKDLSVLGFSRPEINSLSNLDRFKEGKIEVKNNFQGTLF